MIQVLVNSGSLGALAGEAQGFEPLAPGVPYTVTMVSVALELGVPTVIRFPINPESWDRSYGQGWVPRGVPGALLERQDWSSNPAAPLRFEATLQQDEPRLLESQVLKPLEAARDVITRSTQEPPVWIVSFGVHQYRVVLNEVTVTRIRTDARGDATLAKVTVSASDQAK